MCCVWQWKCLVMANTPLVVEMLLGDNESQLHVTLTSLQALTKKEKANLPHLS